MNPDPILTECAKALELSAQATRAPWIPDSVGDSPYVWDQGEQLVAKTWHDNPEQGAWNRDAVAYFRTFSPAAARALRIAVTTLQGVVSTPPCQNDCDNGECACCESTRIDFKKATAALAAIAKEFSK